MHTLRLPTDDQKMTLSETPWGEYQTPAGHPSPGLVSLAFSMFSSRDSISSQPHPTPLLTQE